MKPEYPMRSITIIEAIFAPPVICKLNFFNCPITYIQQPLEQLVGASLTAVKAIIDKEQASSALLRGKLIEKY